MSPFWWNVVWFFCGLAGTVVVLGLSSCALLYYFSRDLEEAESDRYGGSR